MIISFCPFASPFTRQNYLKIQQYLFIYYFIIIYIYICHELQGGRILTTVERGEHQKRQIGPHDMFG